MIKSVIIFLVCFCAINLWSQTSFRVYHEYNIPEMGRTFQMGHVIQDNFEITHDGTGKLYYENAGVSEESMEKTRPVNMVIRMLDIDGNKLQDFEIDYNDIDIDLSGFQIHYTGNRKFLVFTTGRYRFFIQNLSSNIIAGPFISGVEGAAGDSQDGTLGFTEIFNQGQYLIGYAQNFGIFCFNLMDLYHPRAVDHICPDNEHPHKSYFFLDKRGDNIYNGLFIDNHCNGTHDSTRFLFQGKKLEENENGMPRMEKIDGKYIYLHEIKANNRTDTLIVDIQKGKI